MSILSPSISMTYDSSGINDAFEQYRKTCSIIFGRASSSQLRYLPGLHRNTAKFVDLM